MKEFEFLDGVSSVEADVVERFVTMDQKLQKNASTKRSRRFWLRASALAACLALIFGAVLVAPLFKIDEPPLPSVSTMVSGSKLTGVQELTYGNYESDESTSNEVIISHGFWIHTVVEAEVVE